MGLKIGEIVQATTADGEVLALDKVTMANSEGLPVHGFLEVRSGGMVVFVPGSGRFEPDPGAKPVAREREGLGKVVPPRGEEADPGETGEETPPTPPRRGGRRRALADEPAAA